MERMSLMPLRHCLQKVAALVTGMFLAISIRVEAAVINAKSASLADVSFAIRSAHEGDTVMVPAETVSWTSSLVITKGMTLQGMTSIGGSLNSPTVTDGTVVLDDVPRKARGRPSQKQPQDFPQKPAIHSRGQAHARSKSVAALVDVRLKPNQSFRLAGFTFRHGAVTVKVDSALLQLTGRCPSVRVDHCHFDQMYRNPFIKTHGQISGVVDHCIFDERAANQTFQVYHDGWEGHQHGDGSWADEPYFGTEKFLFIEDNTFRNANGYLSVGIDAYGGGRYVARHNYLVDTAVGGHGTETSGRFRGVRAIEVYNNTCVWNLLEPRGQLRSGTMLEFNNVWTGNKKPRSTSTTLTCYREFWPFKFWGGANGSNRLDSNDPHGLYASGTATADSVPSAGSASVTDANAKWVANQWVGYSVTKTTQTRGKEFHPASFIAANTSNTITFYTDTSWGPAMNFASGDGYAIYKLIAALDQPGRGKGDLLTDKNPVATGSWPHQALEPAYAWGNTYNNLRQLNLGSPYPTVQENREFYNQKTPFDGTVGVGVGPVADRPKTCTPAVAYWATDEGEWDSAHDGADGQLYVCSAANTWSFYYKPYTYPHPLVSGTPPSPSRKGSGKH
jgi:hypothetical protein